MALYDGRMRDELLDEHWWRNIASARNAVDAFREDFNAVRSHDAFDNWTPGEFALPNAATLRSQSLTS
jgi:putative transposase